MLNNQYGKRQCVISGKKFESELCLGFFADKDPRRSVSPSEAIKRGFTIREKDLLLLSSIIDRYRSMTRGKYENE